MSKFLIAVDGGGTNTEICIFDKTDESIAIFECESTNYQNIGKEKFEENFLNGMKEAFDALSIKPEDVAGMVLGMSGCDTPKDRKIYMETIEKIGVSPSKIFLRNDCEMMMYASASLPGICITAGTGSIVYAYDSAFDTVRCGGYGSKLSDQGSGFWIGSQILREFLKYTDEQVPHIPVFDEIEDHFGTRNDAIEILQNPTDKQIASVAKLVLDSATDEEDPLCQTIAKAAAFHLASMVATVYKKIKSDDKIDVAMNGSIFKNNELRQMFMEQCIAQTTFKNFNFIEISNTPGEMAIEFARKLFA